MDKRDAIRAMLDGKTVVDSEGYKWRYHEGKLLVESRLSLRWIDSGNINEEECDDWTIYQPTKTGV